MENKLPLSGVRVLELGHIVAGPSASLLLADLGADVIKIEHPDTGDAARNMPNSGSTFYFLNRNKKSLALDLKSEQGKEVFERLVRESDVVIDNFAPGGLERLGISYAWAQSVNPQIIYCSIKGFLSGPNESRPFLDELAQMAGGLAYMTGPANQPLRAGASIIDIGAATYGVLGVIAALYQRALTGKGSCVKAGLFETTVFWVGQHIAWAQLEGRVPDPMPVRSMGGNMGWGVYHLFTTKENRQVFIAVTSNRQWGDLCSALSMEDFLHEESMNTNRKRVAQSLKIRQRIQEIVQDLSFEEVCKLLHRHGVPYAPLNTPYDLLTDWHLNERMQFQQMDVPGLKGFKAPALPIEFEGSRQHDCTTPPSLGEHSVDILSMLGYSPAEIETMERQRVVLSNGKMLKADERVAN